MKNRIRNNISLILIIFLLSSVIISCGKADKDFNFNGIYPPVEIITITENGREYNIEAVSGHIIVYFKPDTQHSLAKQIIERYNGKIISQKIEICYYLVDVGAGNENYFIQQARNSASVDFVIPNAIEYSCLDGVKNYMIDNFVYDFYIGDNEKHMQTNHGDIVKFAFEECGVKDVNTRDAGIPGNEKGGMPLSKINDLLFDIIKDTPKDTPVVINMSLGPSFNDKNIKYWTDENITQDVKDSYVNAYKLSIRRIINQAMYFTDKDFLIVKAAGNEGVKELDKEILNSLADELTDYQKKILYKHFILVGAEDTRDDRYSNTVTSGVYNQLYTAVDISDFEYKGFKTVTGTSIAAPRASCYISKAASDNKIKVTDVRNIINEFQRKNPGKLLTIDILQTEAKKLADAKKAEEARKTEEAKRAEELKKAEEVRKQTQQQESLANLFTGNNSFTVGANQSNTLTLRDGSKIYARLWSMGLGDLALDIMNYADYPVSVSWTLRADNMAPLSGYGDLARNGDRGSQIRWNDFRIVEYGKQALFYEARITVSRK